MAAMMAGAAIAAQPVVALTINGGVGAMLSNSSVVVAAPELRRARLKMLKIITRRRRSIGFRNWKTTKKRRFAWGCIEMLKAGDAAVHL